MHISRWDMSRNLFAVGNEIPDPLSAEVAFQRKLVAVVYFLNPPFHVKDLEQSQDFNFLIYNLYYWLIELMEVYQFKIWNILDNLKNIIVFV